MTLLINYNTTPLLHSVILLPRHAGYQIVQEGHERRRDRKIQSHRKCCELVPNLSYSNDKKINNIMNAYTLRYVYVNIDFILICN